MVRVPSKRGFERGEALGETQLPILRGLSGVVEAGELVFLMGPCGMRQVDLP